MTRRPTTSDPDQFYTPDALVPDPVFMGLRSLITTGPIGRLLAHIEYLRDVREERRIAVEQAVQAANELVTSRQHPLSTIAERESTEHDLAA